MIATTLAFVRTESGTVKLQDGDTVPDDARAGEVDRLVAAGALVKSAEEAKRPKPPRVEDVLAEVGDDPNKALVALEEETARESPRKTLVEKLTELAGVPGV